MGEGVSGCYNKPPTHPSESNTPHMILHIEGLGFIQGMIIISGLGRVDSAEYRRCVVWEGPAADINSAWLELSGVARMSCG